MRILHTADWHIGKLVNGFSMLDDQRYMLGQLLTLIKEEKPDALIVAGDIYDRSVPPADAVELLDEFFTTVALDLNVPLLVISGNHDSPERLNFASKLLKSRGLHIVGANKNEPIIKVPLNDEHGPLNVYLVPFADPQHVRYYYDDLSIRTYDDAMSKLVSEIRKGDFSKEERNILVTHGFITAMNQEVEESESERPLSIGGTDHIDVNHFDDFDYVALGHLHGPQKVKHDHVRYSGSLLKYSFSEVNQNKSVTMVKFDVDGYKGYELIPLQPKRDLRIIEGRLQDLIKREFYSQTNCEDYLQVVLTDRGELIDPIHTLRSVYPNVMQLIRNNTIENLDSRTKATGEFKNKTKLELFSEFYENLTGKAIDKKQNDLLIDVITKAEKEYNV
ncbi:exonuclease SbcCD subunit D [Haloplasma contractile]|uniref:Nuclease SbcCD subunit D n=1 Tax=Haloplasma contractile SSD-17B TaxID=1033810 RepID=U2FE25_9MOLU|nr:exonuclease SbcCD subunit D [Haloplasma contractile]ERJ11225.1 DsDNA exonuclease SbcD protein [Haloplasma contractile SSD-17B]